MKRFYLLLLFCCGFSGVTSAYELATHGRLTYHAYLNSSLTKDKTLLKSLGLDKLDPENAFGKIYYDISGNRIETRTAHIFEESEKRMPDEVKSLSMEGWLLRGAVREDDLGTVLGINVGDDPHDDPYGNIFRVFNHFYDPALNRPLTTATGVLGETAPNWALGTQDAFANPPPPNANRRNHFTILDTREAMYRALTGKNKEGQEVAATKADRDKYWATAFRALGDVVHLIQDMAQPQHTRNDPHSGVPGFGHSSVFERYIDARATGAASFKTDGTKITPAPLLYDGYPIPTFTRYSDLWSTSPGAGSATGNGLADYSNRSFFTAGTNLGSNAYTLPSNNAASYTKESATGLIPELPLQEINFLRGGPENIRMTTEGVFDFFLVSTPPSYSLNRFNYDDQADLLIPRAVAYSAGLIDYFFRGRLAAEGAGFVNDGISLRVNNAIDLQEDPHLKNQVLHAGGPFVLAYRYKLNGQEQAGASSQVALTQDLKPGETTTNFYTFSIPAFPAEAQDIAYRLLFRGKLGEELYTDERYCHLFTHNLSMERSA